MLFSVFCFVGWAVITPGYYICASITSGDVPICVMADILCPPVALSECPQW